MAKFMRITWLLDFLLSEAFDFEWDEGNNTKSQSKHGVTPKETQEVFSGQVIFPLGIQISPKIEHEERFGILGATSAGKKLFISFTIRSANVRVISARPMNKTERELYEDFCKKL